jgi:outer membrane receptor protein involved in Fe transport
LCVWRRRRLRLMVGTYSSVLAERDHWFNGRGTSRRQERCAHTNAGHGKRGREIEEPVSVGGSVQEMRDDAHRGNSEQHADRRARDDVLEPETASSYDGGVKARVAGGRLDAEVSAFRMDFTNLVTSTVVNGLPALINAGETRFQGLELAGQTRLAHSVSARGTYSFHDSTFVDFVQAFDGVPTQLAGKRFEMSARHLASAGLILAPDHGVTGSLVVKHTGDRYLNKRNTALAEPFTTIDLGVGYRIASYEVRVDGRNLTDRRHPVSESELGDAQYYRMFARAVRATLGMRF